MYLRDYFCKLLDTESHIVKRNIFVILTCHLAKFL